MNSHQHSKNGRILLFPLPFQGHINPMLQLASILHSQGGFDISIVHTVFNYPDPSKYPQFTFHRLPDGLSEADASSTDAMHVFRALLHDGVESIRRSLVEFLSEEGGGVACMVTDAHWYFAQSVADDFELPRFVLRTSSACSYIAFNVIPRLRRSGFLDDMETKKEEDVEGLPPLKVKDIPVIEQLGEEDFHSIIANQLDSTKKSAGVIFNTFRELEGGDMARLRGEFQHHMPTFAVGPFHKLFSAASSSLRAQDRSSIEWLDKQEPKSVLYVSFGSVAVLDEEKLHELAWGLANSKQPFLWVVRPGMVKGTSSDQWLELLPSGFFDTVRERSCIVRWAPQQEVLSHRAVGGFLTHSGWNSTLESICEGVPMICAPFFGDQKVNSRYVSDVWKIGIRLEKGIERGEVEEAVIKMMKDADVEEMKQRAMELKEKADHCLTSSGSSAQAIDGLVDLILSFEYCEKDESNVLNLQVMAAHHHHHHHHHLFHSSPHCRAIGTSSTLASSLACLLLLLSL